MKKYIKITPEGTRDYLLDECESFEKICNKLQNVFENSGYRQVITPAVEFFDLFSLESYGIPAEYMFKTTDNKGRILVLRPDSTLPIARIVSTRLKNSGEDVFRLFYKQAVYRNNPTLTGRYNEIMQMGIELIGSVGKDADLEVMNTAISSLECVTPDFRFELGHAEFFSALLAELNANDDTKDKIKEAIENRNYTKFGSLLDSIRDCEVAKVLKRLPNLFGGEEVFVEAYELCRNNEKARAAVEYLEDIYSALCKKFDSENITIDLGLVKRYDYYSGIVFSGYVEGVGNAVLSGGRYDMLMDSFGCPMGASGFAVNVDSLFQLYDGGKL